jgi:hypothetical protein
VNKFLIHKNTPEWARYEQQIAQLIAALDGSAEVVHNKRIKGRLSSVMRQVDVLVRGKIIGQEITIVVECKMTSRPLEIGSVDEFVGKLLDLGADRGVLYSASGMTTSAVYRAEGATSPSVVPVSLAAAPSPNPHGAPGPPDGLDEPDYPEWLDPSTYRRILIGKSWSQSWIRGDAWQPDDRWPGVNFYGFEELRSAKPIPTGMALVPRICVAPYGTEKSRP